MKFLWILESGIHCSIFLLLSVFLLAARGTNTSAPTMLPFRGSTLMVPRNLSMPTVSITSISNGTREESATVTIKIAVPGISNITSTTPGNHSRITAAPSTSLLTTNSTHSLGSGGPSTAAVSTTGANITMLGTTTQDAGRRPLTFWAIILICLTVSGFFIGGYVGCCFLWKKNIF